MMTNKTHSAVTVDRPHVAVDVGLAVVFFTKLPLKKTDVGSELKNCEMQDGEVAWRDGAIADFRGDE